jgi:transposase
MDMSNSFKLALELYYRKPCAIVYDRFHVMKLLHFEIDQPRREEMQKAVTAGARHFLKGHRFLLLRASENLEPDQIDTLEALLKANGTLCTAYILKEQLRLFWDQATRREGERYLRIWIRKARESGVKRLVKFAKTLKDHWDGLVAYFDHRISTGPLEGVNNSIKVLKRKAYGYRDTAFFKLRILFIHECGLKLANS